MVYFIAALAITLTNMSFYLIYEHCSHRHPEREGHVNVRDITKFWILLTNELKLFNFFLQELTFIRLNVFFCCIAMILYLMATGPSPAASEQKVLSGVVAVLIIMKLSFASYWPQRSKMITRSWFSTQTSLPSSKLISKSVLTIIITLWQRAQ